MELSYCVYRSPQGNIDLFLEKLNVILLQTLNVSKQKQVVLAGDFNINFLRETNEKRRLQNLLLSFDLHPVMDEPSRVTHDTSSLIDNIFTNIKKTQLLATRTVNMHISDHMTQIIALKECIHGSIKEIKLISTRNINENTILLFKERLATHVWRLYEVLPAQEAFDSFHDDFSMHFNQCFPITSKKTKEYNDKCHWNTPELQRMSNAMDALCTMAITSQSEDIYNIYRNYKREYLSKVNIAKQTANQRYIDTANNKSKAIWSIIHNETKNILKPHTQNKLNENDMNNYFVNVGNQTPINSTSSVNPCEYLTNMDIDNMRSFYFKNIQENEILSVIKRIKDKKTKDIYDITTHLLKQIAQEITSPLTRLFNKCIIEGLFPKQLKLARVIPVHKKDDVDDYSNYRPIAILPAISKIFEQIIVNRITEYLATTNFMSDSQHGYMKQKSTTTGLIAMVENITAAYDMREYIELTCCDLSKAFDMVCHETLLRKLKFYGIRGLPNSLLASYLSDRQQVVEMNGTRSTTLHSRKGVPQGSILGPLLFILYINDLPSNISPTQSCLYADDTSFIITARNDENLSAKTKKVLEEAKQWFESNGLILNENKTQHLRFCSLNQQSCDKLQYLGITFDSKLSWSQHITELAKKLSSAIYSIRKLKAIATHEAARIAYFANFHSRVSYGILVWGTSASAEKVFLLQKKAIRILCNIGYCDSCKGYFKRENILTVPCIYIYTCVKYVLQNLQQYRRQGEDHEYSTRQKNDIRVPYHRLQTTQGYPDYWGPKFYNKVGPLLQDSTRASLRHIKEVLIENEFYSISDFLSYNFK